MGSREKRPEEKQEIIHILLQTVTAVQQAYLEIRADIKAIREAQVGPRSWLQPGVVLAVIGLALSLFYNSVMNNLSAAKTELRGEMASVKSELSAEISGVAGDVRAVSQDLALQAGEFNLILEEFRIELRDLRGSIDALQQVTEPQAYESLRIGVLEDNPPFSEYIELKDLWQGEDLTIVEEVRRILGVPEEKIEYLPMDNLTEMATGPCDYDFSFVNLDAWKPMPGYDFRYISVSDFFPGTMTEAWTHSIVVPICETGDIRFAFDLYLAKLKASPR